MGLLLIYKPLSNMLGLTISDKKWIWAEKGGAWWAVYLKSLPIREPQRVASDPATIPDVTGSCKESNINGKRKCVHNSKVLEWVTITGRSLATHFSRQPQEYFFYVFIFHKPTYQSGKKKKIGCKTNTFFSKKIVDNWKFTCLITCMKIIE